MATTQFTTQDVSFRATHVINSVNRHTVPDSTFGYPVSFSRIIGASQDFCLAFETDIGRLTYAAYDENDTLRDAYRLIIAARSAELIRRLELNHVKMLDSIRLFSTVMTVAEQEADYAAWIQTLDKTTPGRGQRIPVSAHVRPILSFQPRSSEVDA
tara:strand:- start:596 stop:1063 length:468 start_codon:yes stop_codon:yes gene_type:complete